MNKKLWIQDVNKFPEVYYHVTKKIKFNKRKCNTSCEFYEVRRVGAKCWLFNRYLSSYDRSRLDECIEMFGE